MAQPSADERKSRWPVSPVVLGVLFMLAYPLSIGPAAWLAEAGVIKEGGTVYEALTAFYAPLAWMAERFPRVGDVLISYMLWWGD